MIDMNALTASLREIYGPKKGQSVCLTIMPGILADFQKMLLNAPVGETIREEYRTEDGRAVIALQGRREAAGGMDVSARVL